MLLVTWEMLDLFDSSHLLLGFMYTLLWELGGEYPPQGSVLALAVPGPVELLQSESVKTV